MTIEKNAANAAYRNLVDDDVIRTINNAFAFCFKETRLSTTGSSDTEHNKYLGEASTIMRGLTSKNGYLLAHFDKIDESQAEIIYTSLNYHLSNNHNVAAKKGKIKEHLSLEDYFWILQTI